MSTTATTHTAAARRPAGRGAPRHRVDGTLVGRLNVEWAELRSDPTSTAQVQRWRRTADALAEFDSLADIEAAAHTRPAADADPALLALLRLAATGDALATRTVLQLMLPWVVRRAGAPHALAMVEESQAVLIAAMLEAIHHYQLNHRHNVAATLGWDALARRRGSRRRRLTEVPTDGAQLSGLVDLRQPTAAAAPAGCWWPALGAGLDVPLTVDAEVASLLADARRDGAITASERELLRLVYTVDEDGQPRRSADVAAHLEISEEAMRKRCSRAVHRVAAYVVESQREPHTRRFAQRAAG